MDKQLQVAEIDAGNQDSGDERQTEGGMQTGQDLRWNWRKINKEYSEKQLQTPQNFDKQVQKKEQSQQKQQYKETTEEQLMESHAEEQEYLQPVHMEYKVAEEQEAQTQVEQKKELIIGQSKQCEIKKEQIKEVKEEKIENTEKAMIKQYMSTPQQITKFSVSNKSKTIEISQCLRQATQEEPYYDNFKLALTDPIASIDSSAKFKVSNLKYCVGFGVCLQQVVQKHNYCYQSDSNEMSHGLYIVTSQGYSWSHSQKEDDDCRRQGFNLLYNGANVEVRLMGEELQFKWKKGSFKMILPSRIREKYTLTFCAYVHDKNDAIAILQ